MGAAGHRFSTVKIEHAQLVNKEFIHSVAEEYQVHFYDDANWPR